MQRTTIGLAALLGAAAACGLGAATAQSPREAASRHPARRRAAPPPEYDFMDRVGFPQDWHPHRRAADGHHVERESRPAAHSAAPLRGTTAAYRPASSASSTRRPLRSRPAAGAESPARRTLHSPYAFMDTVGFPQPYHLHSAAIAPPSGARRSSPAAHPRRKAGRKGVPPGYVEVR
jgi:hypothetical protein